MMNKFGLLIMSTFLLSQLLPYAYAKAIFSPESKELNLRKTLRAAIIGELNTTLPFYLKEGAAIYKKVIADLETMSDMSEELEGYVKKMNDFIASVEKREHFDWVNDDFYIAYFQFMELTFKFLPCDVEYIQLPMTNDEILVKELLVEYGFQQLEKDLKKHYDKFAKTITESIEIYANTLNDEEKAKDSKFFEWLKKFKDTDDDATMRTLTEFLHSCKDESSVSA